MRTDLWILLTLIATGCVSIQFLHRLTEETQGETIEERPARALASNTTIPDGFEVRLSEGSSSPSRRVPCSIPCYWSSRQSLVATYRALGTPYRILYSMEGPQYYPQLRTRPDARTGLATTSMDSDVPVPYLSDVFLMQHVQPAVPRETEGAASFIATNCNSKNGRETVVKELRELYPVHALASCLHGDEPVPASHKHGDWGSSKVSIMRKYLFHLAFENQNEVDYVTEKVWLGLMSGTLPVYMGAPNVRDLVPSNSMIFWDDFTSVASLAEHLRYLESNRTAYLEYHAWRDRSLEDRFLSTYKDTSEHVECRMCKWVASRKLHLVWDRQRQEVIVPQVTPRAGIPHILHQTARSWGESRTFTFRDECQRMYRADGWRYMYWTDENIEDFMRDAFPQYFEGWRAMKPLIRRVDTVRYLWMYTYGGVYVDADAECVRPASGFVDGMNPAPTAWMGGFPEPFFLMSSPGNAFWLFVVESILKNWRIVDTRRSSGPQGLNRWAREWVIKHGLRSVRSFEMRNTSELDAIGDRNGAPSWRWYVSASDFVHAVNRTTPHAIGFLPNEVIDPTACLGHSQYGCQKQEHCHHPRLKRALFVHHRQNSHGV